MSRPIAALASVLAMGLVTSMVFTLVVVPVLYSYLVRGGILEGRDGFVFCMMKSEYQRMVVAKKHDMRKRAR